MDELTLLRSARALPIASLADLSAGRTALDRAISGTRASSSDSRRRLRRRGWSFAGAGIAALVAIALVVSGVVDLGQGQRGSAADAQEILHTAARKISITPDPIVGTSQYLEIQTRAVSLATQGDANGKGVSWLALSTSSLFVPGSMSRAWVLDQSPSKPYAFFGAESQSVAEANWAATLAQHGGSNDYYSAKNGAFGRSPQTYPLNSLSSFPRDPQKLVSFIRSANPGAGTSKNGEAFTEIEDLLVAGYAPADLRAALYKALALIPGVTVTERTATLDGQSGTAIGRTEQKTHLRQEVIIDPTTGRFIGEREVLINGYAQFGIPAGTVVDWTSVTTRVVNAAPKRP